MSDEHNGNLQFSFTEGQMTTDIAEKADIYNVLCIASHKGG